MRLKRVRILVLLVITVIVFTACTQQTQTTVDISTDHITEKKNISTETPVEDQQMTDTDDEITGHNQDDASTTEESSEVAVQPEQPKEEKAQDPNQKQTTGEYGHLDNISQGWWYRKGKDHAPSTTNPDIVELIEPYDGFFIEHTDEKVLYLTFDEGYENGYTPKILDILKENKVPAAFFITGPYLKKHSDLVKRMVEEGHIVGNHSVNHPSMPKILDEKKLEEEILGLERPFYEMFQKNMHYFRPPRGEYSERTLAITQSLGYKTVFWSFAYKDWEVDNQKGADYAYNNVMNGLHNGAVLLLHAVSKDNTDALDRIIKDAREKGYEFKSLDDLKITKSEE